MDALDKKRWLALSPLLDELLDLDEPARGQRLAQLRAEDPALAEHLDALLVRDAALSRQGFLEQPAAVQLQGVGAEALAASAAASAAADIPGLPDLSGQSLGPYTLERELGQGGMGTVWLAHRADGRFEGQVAVKFLKSTLIFGSGKGDSGRFAREGQILARLSHPHIARLLDAGVHQGHQPYLVLEYVDGLPIDRYCQQHGLDVESRVRLFLDVLSAVAHAHQRLILHRDLKPSNILVTPQREVKLLDFGIAKLMDDATQAQTGAAATELTQRAGSAFTPQYAAPEQVQQLDVTTATDVYALGVLLYLLLGGRHPTADDTQTQLDRLRAVVELEPKRLSDVAGQQLDPAIARQARLLKGDLDTILSKALKKKPSERYANAEQFAADLQHWLAHEPITARPDSAWYRSAMFIRRHRLGVGAGSVAVLALGVGVGVALWEGREARHQRDQAEGLIEFMLGDLRKKLEPVGRLDVLDSVGEKSLGYYAQQDLARSDADSLGRRARALHLMGEIAEKRGKMGEAEQRFTEAAATTAVLLERDPKNTQRLFDHAQSSYWVGYAAWQQRKQGPAEAGFQKYLELANELVRLEPGKVEWLEEQASAQSNLGVLKLRSGAVAESVPHFEAARTILSEGATQQPKFQAVLGTTLGWLAEAQSRLGLYDASIASHREKLKALDTTRAGNGPDKKHEQRIATTAVAMGRLHLNAGRADEAVAAGSQARTSLAALSSMDPDNLDALERLAFARQFLVEALFAQSKLEAAQVELTQVGDELGKLLQADARKPAWSQKLKGQWLTYRLVLATAPDRSAHQQALADFLRTQKTTGSKPAPDMMEMLATAHIAYGDSLKPEDPKAAEHWRAALDLLPPATGSTDWRVICWRAHALARLGHTQEALALADNLEASAFRHPIYTDLRRRLSS